MQLNTEGTWAAEVRRLHVLQAMFDDAYWAAMADMPPGSDEVLKAKAVQQVRRQLGEELWAEWRGLRAAVEAHRAETEQAARAVWAAEAAWKERLFEDVPGPAPDGGEVADK